MKAINKLEPSPPTTKERRATMNATQQAEYLMEIKRWRRDRDQARIDAMHEYERRFRHLIVHCEAETKASFSEVFEVYRERRGKWAALRRRFYRIMRDEGLSFPDIGKLCGVSHTTVISALLAPNMDDMVHP